MKCTVEQDRDRVVLAFSSRGQSLGLHFEQATALVDAIKGKASEAKAWAQSGGKRSVVNPNDARSVAVQAKDGKVWLLFSEGTDRELIPFEAAFQLAEEIQSAVVDVMYKIAFQYSKKWGEL